MLGVDGFFAAFSLSAICPFGIDLASSRMSNIVSSGGQQYSISV
jgi:hypothetical protein